MRRNLLLSLLLISGLLSAVTAQAHEPPMTMTASSDIESNAVEATTTSGPWSFKVIGLTGKPSKVILIIATDSDGDAVIDQRRSIMCSPRVGKICDTDPNQDVSAGTQNLTLRVSSGKSPSTVTIEIYHP